VGVAWLLDLPEPLPPAGEVPARQDGEFTWIGGRRAPGGPGHPPGHRLAARRQEGQGAQRSNDTFRYTFFKAVAVGPPSPAA
jgi:hypothetical protein